jgi:hypothetical protein
MLLCSNEFLVAAGLAPLQRKLTKSLRRSFDHLAGALLQKPRHIDAKRLGGLEVDDQLEFATDAEPT